MSRCTGKCCTRFLLSEGATLADIREQAERARSDPEMPVVRVTDAMAIEDMLIPFDGPWMERTSPGVYGEGWEQNLRENPTFTCKHFDGRFCTIYERRPRMCRDHGVGTACNWAGHGCEFEPALARRKAYDERVAESEKAAKEISERIDVPLDKLTEGRP